MSKNGKRVMLSTKIDVISAIVAIAAMFISVRACQVSRDQAKVALLEYEDARLAIWSARPDEKNETLALRATSEGVVLQRAVAEFPTHFGIGPLAVDAPDHDLPLQPIRFTVEEMLKKRFPAKKNIAEVAKEQVALPVVIESNYVVKGRAYSDRSLYFITYRYVIMPLELGGRPAVTFTSLVFGRRLEPNEDGVALLNNMWVWGETLKAPS